MNPFAFDHSPPPPGVADRDLLHGDWRKKREMDIARRVRQEDQLFEYGMDMARMGANMPAVGDDPMNLNVRHGDVHYNGVNPAQTAVDQRFEQLASRMTDVLSTVKAVTAPQQTAQTLATAAPAAAKAFGWKHLLGLAAGSSILTAIMTLFPWGGAAMNLLKMIAFMTGASAPAPTEPPPVPTNQTSTIEKIERFKQVFYDQDGNEIKVERLPPSLRKN